MKNVLIEEIIFTKLAELSNEEAGQLFKAIDSFRNRTEINLAGLKLITVWTEILPNLDRVREKSDRRSKASKLNGIKGGRPILSHSKELSPKIDKVVPLNRDWSPNELNDRTDDELEYLLPLEFYKINKLTTVSKLYSILEQYGKSISNDNFLMSLGYLKSTIDSSSIQGIGSVYIQQLLEREGDYYLRIKNGFRDIIFDVDGKIYRLNPFRQTI